MIVENNEVENVTIERVHMRRLEENARFNYEIAIAGRSETWEVQSLNLNGDHPFAFDSGKSEIGGQNDITLRFSNMNGGHCQIDI